MASHKKRFRGVVKNSNQQSKFKSRRRSEQELHEARDLMLNAARRFASNHYDAGKTGRLQNDWTTTTDTPSQNFKTNWRTIISRAIHSADNNPHTVALLKTLDSNVIGRGLRPMARVKNRQDTLEVGINKILNEGWKRYNDQWDATGRWTQAESQSGRFGEIWRTGSTITNLRPAPKGNFLPIHNQVVNVLRLDEAKDLQQDSFNDPTIKNTMFGINLNEDGKAVSYWIQGVDRPVGADVMRLDFNKTVAEQYIGVPWLYAALKYLWANENLITDKLLASRMQAMIALFIPDGLMNRLFKQQKNADGQLELEPGKVYYGENKDDMPQIIQADDSVKDVLEPLQRLLLHAITMTQGVSYQAVTRDLVKTNMASGRMNVNEDRKIYRKLQKMIAKTICQPDWDVYVKWMFISGQIPGKGLSDYLKDPWKFSQAQWIPNGFDFIDPSKEASAAIDLQKNNMITYEEWYAEKGQDWRAVFKQISEEKALMKELKIEPVDIENAALKEKSKVVSGGSDDEEDED